jgi:hypothetical protein
MGKLGGPANQVISQVLCLAATGIAVTGADDLILLLAGKKITTGMTFDARRSTQQNKARLQLPGSFKIP